MTDERGSPPADAEGEPEVIDFGRISELTRGFWAPRILLTAVELDLFEALGGQSLTAAELAQRLDADRRGVELLCNALVALGLLARQEGRYSNAPVARRYLDASSPEYRGSYVRLGAYLWQRWSRLTQVVRAGGEAIGPEWDPRARREFALAMHQGKPGAGELLVSKLDLHGVRRAVDLGGGSGTFAEALALALPEAQVVLVDRGEAIEVARSRLPAELLGRRVTLVECDFMADGIPLAGDPPGPYDLALLSSVLHAYGPEDNAALLGRLYEALEPGGQVVIRDFIVDAAGTRPPEAALFAVNMLVNTREGRCYSFEEIRGWLHGAGFGEVERQPFQGAIELVTARRA